MKHTPEYDVVVVGAGIIGLATAREISKRYSGLKIGIVEKEPKIAGHQTSHNSGVMHSGIYYQPGSIKAELSIAGRSGMVQFCEENGIPYEICGKVIVATNEEELPRLEQLLDRGRQNGIPHSDLEIIGPERLRELEPHSTGLGALYVQTTGIVDYSRVAQAMADQFRERNGNILTDTQVIGIRQQADRIDLLTTHDTLGTRYLINCAGLYSDKIASMMGVETGVRIIPFRGEYYSLREEASYLVNNLIYPVPDPALPFLGVHLTRTIHGVVEAGPNAVLALAKEGYKKSDVNLEEICDMIQFIGSWRMARKHWRIGLDEMIRSISKGLFARSLRKLVPEITTGDLQPFPAGVRAQAVAADGSLVSDFTFASSKRALHVINTPSPAATASLAIAGHIIEKARKGLDAL